MVPGGLTSFCLSIEVDLRQDFEKRSLALDIFNMFNEACRLATEEDLERSLELLGVDLSMMSLYVHMAHNCASHAWFWVETPAKRGTVAKGMSSPSRVHSYTPGIRIRD
eukprot:SAG31_NODE_17249_length_678_cov_0.747841_2_plen_109_part_00